jgi:hypothetical protein
MPHPLEEGMAYPLEKGIGVKAVVNIAKLIAI